MICTKQPAAARISEWQVRGALRIREVRYRADAEQSRHCHAEGGLSLVVGGELEETTSETCYRAAAGSLVIKPPQCWHANRYGPRGTHVVQVLTADGRAPWDNAACEHRWSESPRLTRLMLALVSDAPAAAELAEMELWDVLDALQPLRFEYRRSSRPRWWPDAVDLLNQCTTRSVSVAAVAMRVGVHPVYLARVCRRQLGCTVQQYVRQRRVLAAWRSWDGEEKPLAAIALEVGFADQAHMTRAFVEQLGVSPGRLRRWSRRFRT
jgi:AraC-like DNA-binding protein/quercetin dioxygenase-like cupin family protein